LPDLIIRISSPVDVQNLQWFSYLDVRL